jgi:peptidylprolyl isomerase
LKSRLYLSLAIFLVLPLLMQSQTPAKSRRPKYTSPTPETPAKASTSQLPPGVPPVATPLQTAFALQFQDIEIGSGVEAQPGQLYTVHYTGWLAFDGSKFDSSIDRGEPVEFTQGTGQVITGWDQGFTGMRVGGKRRLFVPYQLAFGVFGEGVVPPKADVIFDVELVAVHGMTMPPPRLMAPFGTIPAAPPQPRTPQQPPTPRDPGAVLVPQETQPL